MISALSRMIDQTFSSGDSENLQTSPVGGTTNPEQPKVPNQTTMSTSTLGMLFTLTCFRFIFNMGGPSSGNIQPWQKVSILE